MIELLLVGTAMTRGSTAHSIVEESEYRANGFRRHFALGREPQFRCVGAFRDGCTGGGVWFGGRYVLTTAHSVVDTKTKGYRNPSWYEYVLIDLSGREHVFRVKAFHVTKAYLKSVGNEGYWGRWGADVAVAELDRVPNLSGVAPAVLGFNVPGKGEVLTLVSYGNRGTTGQGTLSEFGSGFKDRPPRPMGFRVGVRYVSTSDHHINLLFRKGASIDLQGITSSCDSGGGAFAQVAGEWRLLGTIFSSQMASLEGQMKVDSVDMGVTAVKPLVSSILIGARSGNWTEFENHDPAVDLRATD